MKYERLITAKRLKRWESRRDKSILAAPTCGHTPLGGRTRFYFQMSIAFCFALPLSVHISSATNPTASPHDSALHFFDIAFRRLCPDSSHFQLHLLP